MRENALSSRDYAPKEWNSQYRMRNTDFSILEYQTAANWGTYCFLNRTVQTVFKQTLPDRQQEATEEAEGLQASETHGVGRYCRSLEKARFHCTPQFYLTMSFHSVRSGSWRNQIPSVHIGTKLNEEETKVHFSVQFNQCAIGQILVRPGHEPQPSMSDLNISTILKPHQLFNLFFWSSSIKSVQL